MPRIELIAFGLFVLLAVGGMVLILVEAAAWFGLRGWAFRHGPVVLRAVLPSVLRQQGGRGIELTESGRYRFVSSDTAIFCFGRSWSYMVWRLRTAVPIKGTITWRDGHAEVTGRLSLGIVLFQSFWLGAALVVWIFHLSWATWWQFPALLLAAFLTGPAFIPFERRRTLRVAHEIVAGVGPMQGMSLEHRTVVSQARSVR